MDTIHTLNVRGISIPTNVFFAPINPGYSINGIIQDDFKRFFSLRSGNNIGICYIGNVALQKKWSSNINTAALYATPPNEWSNLIQRIINNGSLPGIQLAWKPTIFTLQRTFVTDNVAEQVSIFKKFYEEFEDYEKISELILNSINYVSSLGFSVVQLHAAHGYALSLLLSRAISGCDNPGDTKGAHLLKSISTHLLKKNFIFDIRLSLFEGIDDTCELEYKIKLVKLLIDYGFDMISFSNGFYNINKKMIYPSKSEDSIVISFVETLAKQYPSVIWNVAGNMEKILEQDLYKLKNISFSLGRQLISDPQTITKILNKDFKTIKRCTECNACHYYSFGYNGIRECQN